MASYLGRRKFLATLLGGAAAWPLAGAADARPRIAFLAFRESVHLAFVDGLRRRAWLRIFVVRCGVPCDPPVGGHPCNGVMIARFHRAVSD